MCMRGVEMTFGIKGLLPFLRIAVIDEVVMYSIDIHKLALRGPLLSRSNGTIS